MTNKIIHTVEQLVFISLFLVVFSAYAEDAQPRLALQISAEKQVTVERDGETVTETVPATSTESGDVLVYTITYTNQGNAPATNASIVDPVPGGVIYSPNSAQGTNSEITLSVDGGHLFQQPPASYTVHYPDGSSEQKLAPPEMVTHIKWVVRSVVQPGQSGVLKFNAVVK